ncbi:hypothetical protein QQY66_49095 [Streptomyces sp. DG2A-72]|uniref:hypothetical protein n=1 Tax=Streptomyces sp. DG2A-72 TaxID=3051386 RepID=UPI00265C6158|nr:hypothetical protein [Streptomyces sp. DG2A-72]MDO0939271.1 hypothetical protein [Streptomyces sp. DG2A-72]
MSTPSTAARTVAPDTLRSRRTATEKAAKCAVLRATQATRRTARTVLDSYADPESAR